MLLTTTPGRARRTLAALVTAAYLAKRQNDGAKVKRVSSDMSRVTPTTGHARSLKQRIGHFIHHGRGVENVKQ